MKKTMTRVLMIGALLWGLGFVTAPAVLGQSYRSEADLRVNEPVRSDLYWSGNTAEINASVGGDLYLASQNDVLLNAANQWGRIHRCWRQRHAG